MGGDSCSEGHGFKFWPQILDGHFFTYICCKNCMKRPKINNKRGRGWPILKKDLNSAAQAIVPKIIPLEQRAF